MSSSTIENKALNDFKVRDIPGIWGLTFKQEWVVDNLIPASAVTMLSGESGSGKSTLTLALADAVSNGQPFLGYNTKQTPVLILDRENGLPVYHERLERFQIKESTDLLVWGTWVIPAPPGPEARTLKEFVKAEHPLIIFDSFIGFHPGNEQDASETRRYMDHFRELAGLGASIILIHHTGKSLSTKVYRGSSDIKASVDVLYVLNVKRPRLQLLELKPDKVREGMLDPISISVEEDKFVRLDHAFITPDDVDWQKVTAVLKLSSGLTTAQIAEKLPDIAITKIRKILKAGEMKGTYSCLKGNHNTSYYSLSPVKPAQGA
jgi:archaellum biogenesis ATPase FlaH